MTCHSKTPTTPGSPLSEALGGEKLLKLLEDEPEGPLVLELDDEADAIPWELAATPKERDRDLLVARYSMVRLVNRDAPPPRGNGPLQLIFLAEDPLEDKEGRPVRGSACNSRRKCAACAAPFLAATAMSWPAASLPPKMRCSAICAAGPLSFTSPLMGMSSTPKQDQWPS